MRKFRMSLLVAVALLPGANATFACGDKLILASRGAHGMKLSPHPGTILIYMRTGSSLSDSDRRLRLHSTLTMAGHKASVVDAPEKLGQALKSRKYDLVVADSHDATAVQEAIASSSSSATIVPVTPEPSAKSSEVLAAVDDAMIARRKGQSAASK